MGPRRKDAPRSGTARKGRPTLGTKIALPTTTGRVDAIASHLLNRSATIPNLYTMFASPPSQTPITPAIDALPITTSNLNTLPSPLRRWLLPLYPKAITNLTTKLHKHHNQSPIDLLISTSSSAIKSLQTPQGVPHICYCHAPARYLWSQQDQYTQGPGLKTKLRAAGLDKFGNTLRQWDKDTANAPTTYIANSNFIATQIRSIYNRDALVIHPPVRTHFFTPPETTPPQSPPNTLLYVGALEPYKRVDLAIDAALLLNRPLTIIGTGSHQSALHQHANNNPLITFLTNQSDEQVRSHMQSASAFLQPQTEDFGITAVEAQSTGTPVVARRAGGALDSVIESKTGTLFDHPSPQELAHAIETLDRIRTKDTPLHCRTNALRFSYESFHEKLKAVIDHTLNSTP